MRAKDATEPAIIMGADLLNFLSWPRLEAHMLGIGGEVVFNGVFLVGIAAALLA